MWKVNAYEDREDLVPPTAVGVGGIVASVTSALGLADAIRRNRRSDIGPINQTTIGQRDNSDAMRSATAGYGFLFNSAETTERIGNMRREGHRATYADLPGARPVVCGNFCARFEPNDDPCSRVTTAPLRHSPRHRPPGS